MALFSDFFSRQLSLSGGCKGSLRAVFRNFQCLSQDEVFLEGGLTGGNVPAFACKFSRNGLHGNLLAIADEEGSVRLMDTRRPASKSFIKEIGAHRNAIFDIAWLPGDSQLLTASGDTKVGLWDVVGGVKLSTFEAHTSSVKTVDVKANEPSVFVSGGRDGTIYVWDTRCAMRNSKHRPVNTISMAHKKAGPSGSIKRRGRGQRGKGPPTSDLKHSVTSVCFHGDNKIASAGTADGIVKLWDLRRNYSSCKKEPPPAWHSFAPVGDTGSFSSLVSDPTHSFLFASCTDNIIYMYSTANLNKIPVETFSGHKNSTFYVKACTSSDGQYLLSGSSCGNAFIWEIGCCEAPPLTLVGHVAEVTAVNWCPTQIDKVATCSDDNDVRIWRVDRSRENAQLGKYVGSCEEYTGKGYLKAQEVLKTIREQNAKEKEKARSPLNIITPNSSRTGKAKTDIHVQSAKMPKMFQFMSQNPTVTQGSTSLVESAVSSGRPSNIRGSETSSHTLVNKQNESNDIVRTSTREKSTNTTKLDKTSTQDHSLSTAPVPCRDGSKEVHKKTLQQTDLDKQSLTEETKMDDSVVVLKSEMTMITPERSGPPGCETRKRKLLFEPHSSHELQSCSSSGETPKSERKNDDHGGDSCPSKKRKTQPSIDNKRTEQNERVVQSVSSPSNTRQGRRKATRKDKTPHRDAKQLTVQRFFKPNTI